VLSQAILNGASPQIRNMATTAGNLLQRTRCMYFRDTSMPCNKREPGTGCPAITGSNRMLAILGTSEHCLATNPSDMCVAMAALEATIHIQGPKGTRAVPFREFHLRPGDTPSRETVLESGDLITHGTLPPPIACSKQVYLKLRDRASYEFALASAGTFGNPKPKFSTNSFICHFVEVTWQPEIARLRVSRVVTVLDAGRIINPLAARNQIMGDAVPFYGFNRPGAKASQGLIDSFWLQGMLAGHKAVYDCIKAFSETDFTEDLKKIDVPTLILHGDDDQIVPIADSALLSAKLAKDATLKIIPGAPHGMCSTLKDQINAELPAFFQQAGQKAE
jgi:hypothetical protein